MATKAAVEEVNAETAQEEWLEEMVTVRLPIIPGKEKQEAQYVAVVGKGEWVIPRGENFQIPRYAALVLQEAEEEQLNAIRYINEQPYRREN